jgi:hypothetical protein
MLLFRSARRALRCAIAIQRAFAASTVPHLEAPLRVRIGLHAGETVRNADAFFGRAVYKAARIAAQAQGSEIVVSGLFREITENAEEFRFHSRRQVELKGLGGPCDICSVAWEEPGAAPPHSEDLASSSEHLSTQPGQEEMAAAGAESAAPPAPSSALDATLRREGDYWTVAYGDSVSRVREMKGLHYLVHLLQHPGQEVHVLDLIGQASARGHAADVDRPAAAGPLPRLDDRAKAAYRERIEELRTELADAEGCNDVGRVARAREEIDVLTQQLAAAVGLGGRDRPAGAAAERARTTVTQRLRTVIQKIAQRQPGLADHLTARVRTGTFCVYQPDPERPIVWELGEDR